MTQLTLWNDESEAVSSNNMTLFGQSPVKKIEIQAVSSNNMTLFFQIRFNFKITQKSECVSFTKILWHLWSMNQVSAFKMHAIWRKEHKIYQIWFNFKIIDKSECISFTKILWHLWSMNQLNAFKIYTTWRKGNKIDQIIIRSYIKTRKDTHGLYN